MNKTNRSRMNTLTIVIVSIYLVACQATSPAPSENTLAPGISINITNSTCPSITVSVGDQITWTNQDNSVHMITIKSAEGNEIFSSGDLQTDDTASLVMPRAGTFNYVCSSDQKSSGTITVEP